MAGPWERFAEQPAAPAPSAGPWAKYGGGGESAQLQPAAPVTWGETIKREAGNALQATDDIVRLMANAATFGMADRFAGAMEGTGKEAERAKTKAAGERAGWAGTAAEAVGSMGPAGLLAKAGLAAGAATGAARYVPAVAGSAGLGATMGALDAAGNDRDPTTGALVGAGAGLLGHGAGKLIGAGVNRAAQAMGKGVPPTAEAIKAQGTAAYKAAENAGVIVSPQATARLQNDIQQKLTSFAYEPELFPKVPALLNALNRSKGQNVTLSGLENFRKIAGNIAGSNDRGERAVGRALKETIDDFMTGIKPGDTIAGNAPAAVGALQNARQAWQRQAKSDDLGRAMEKATTSTAGAGTGGNIDNRIRQQLAKTLERGRGWTPDERAALERGAQGTATQNALRLAGRLSPTTGGLQALLGLGATVANPALGPAFLAGAGAKMTADKMSKANAKYVDQLIRAGGSARALDNMQALPEAQRQALIRALAGMSAVPAQGLSQPVLAP